MKVFDKNLIALEAKKELARREFFSFCKALASDFYQDDMHYLVELANTLQALYEGRIIRFVPTTDWKIVDDVSIYSNYQECKKLMMNMPPQHGKSRTLINFCCWVFGKNPTEKIITCSYGDDPASDFSRYTRDEIAMVKKQPDEIVYSDIFPKTRIKRGNSSFEKWALENQHFSYMGKGVGGAITGKGGTILIVDDPVKGVEEAMNENHLEKLWNWYTNTFRSRVSAKDGEPFEIVNMTRWADGDICGKLLESSEAREWYVLKFEAYDEKTNKMLCERLLSKKRYHEQKNILDISIFMANYHQQPINQLGKLYSAFKTYEQVPADNNGNPLFTGIYAYTDTADEGSDYLATFIWGDYNKEAYILDVLYTQKPNEVTEPILAQMLRDNEVDLSRIESNNGGKAFARNVKRILEDDLGYNFTDITWFHQSKNKNSRILSNSTWVINHVYFPINWRDRWPQLYRDLNKYQREGKNAHDDAPDAVTGVAETMYLKHR